MSITSGYLDDVHRDMEHGVYDFTKDGKCSCCGSCCTNILPMNQYEIKTIRTYIKKNKIKEHVHSFPTSEKQLDLVCPFLDMTKEKKCDIYEVRPKICREFSCHKTFDNIAKFGKGYVPILVREEFFK